MLSMQSSPDQALKRLESGNLRSLAPHEATITNTPNRNKLADGQSPYAVILGCSDSRVPPEIVFDEQAGNLFVVRVAGNVVDSATMGSIEYGVEHLHAKIVLVLGHASCGAVKAARSSASDRSLLTKNIQYLLHRVDVGKNQATADASAVHNVQHQMQLLRSDRLLNHEIAAGKLRVVGGFFDIATGKVRFLR